MRIHRYLHGMFYSEVSDGRAAFGGIGAPGAFGAPGALGTPDVLGFCGMLGFVGSFDDISAPHSGHLPSLSGRTTVKQPGQTDSPASAEGGRKHMGHSFTIRIQSLR